MVQRFSLSRRLIVITVSVSFLLLLLLISFISISTEIRIDRIYEQASEDYLDSQITNMHIASHQFVQSINNLIGGMKVALNKTVNTVRTSLFSDSAFSTYVSNISFYNNQDCYSYIDGYINSSVDRISNIYFYDSNSDGINDMELPGAALFGDVKSQLNISGEYYLQINASIQGTLSEDAKIFLYAYVNESSVPIEFTNEYKTVLGENFDNTMLSEWRSDNPTLPITIEDTLHELQPEYLQSYFLILEPSNSSITISKISEKSRIDGCVNGSLDGYYKGTIQGNLNGEISGYIDKRPMEINSFFPPFLAPFLEWVYFATPNYIIIFPIAPDYRIDLGAGLGLSANFDWLKRPWYSEILEQEQEKVLAGGTPSNESYFSDLGIDYVHQNLFMSLGQAVYNETGNYEGLFVLDFNLEYMMDAINLAITEDDFNLIVNKNGDILLSPEYLKNISRTPKEVFPTENIYDLNNSDLETAFFYSKQGYIGNATLTFENESYILIYQEIAQLDWYLLHFTPEDLVREEFNPLLMDLEKHLRAMQAGLIIGSIFIILFISIFGVILSYTFRRYLQTLLNGIHAVSEGDLSFSFKLAEEQKISELTEVFYAFEEMALKLDESLRKERDASYFAQLTLDLFVHDLSNYYQALRGYINFLEKMVTEDPHAKEIVENLDRILNKADELRSKVVKLQLGEEKSFVMKRNKLVPYIDEAEQYIRRTYPDYDITIDKNFEEGVEVLADSFLVDIFKYLLENGLNSANDQKIHFVVTANRIQLDSKKFWQISVEDDGKGISDDHKKQITSSFRKGKRIKGLGMMVVFKIIRMIGGSLSIEDRIKGDYTKGAKIIFTLRDSKE